MEYKIDASNRAVGRVATEAAMFLMGKNTPEFQRHISPKVKVIISNVSKAKITQKKMKEKEYQRYSGYPGGLKKRTMEEVITKKGYKEVFEKAIYGMLPANRLRSGMMKNLVIND